MKAVITGRAENLYLFSTVPSSQLKRMKALRVTARCVHWDLSIFPAYAAGTRTGIVELAPHLIGEDPTQLFPLNQRMDIVLKGHPYVKSAIDIACWDILGKVSNQPVCTLLGGRYGEDFMLYRAISQQSPDEMAEKVATYRAEGYRKFQLKVGGDPNTDIERIQAVAELMQPGDVLIADANTGWLMHQAAPRRPGCERCGCLY